MATDRQKLFLEGPIGRAPVTLAAPIILVNVLQTGYQLTDAFWVGRLGASAVAAVSVSLPVTFLVIALGAGLAIAGATLTAQYAGAGRPDMVNHVAAQTLVMVALTSVVLGALGYALSPPLLTLLGVAPDVRDQALGFMRVSFAGIAFVFLYLMFQALMRGVGQTRVPLYIVSATVALNFLLDPLLIFGWGPVPALGVLGAALATLVTQALAAAAGLAVLLRGRHGIRLTWRAFRPDPGYLRRAFLLGLPGSVEISTRGFGVLVMSFLVASFGTETIAAYGVGSNVFQVITIPAMGLSMAASTLVGQNIGAGQVERAARVTRIGAAARFGLLTLVGLGTYLLAPLVVAFFIPGDPGVIAEGPVPPNHVPGVGRDRRPALRRVRLPGVGQHAERDGDRAGRAVGGPVPGGVHPVEAHAAAGGGTLVVVPGDQRGGGGNLGPLVRQGEVEDDAADGGGQAGRRRHRRGDHRGRRPVTPRHHEGERSVNVLPLLADDDPVRRLKLVGYEGVLEADVEELRRSLRGLQVEFP